MLRVFGAPSRYLQGPNALAEMGPYLSHIGKRTSLVTDSIVMDLIGTRVQKVCAAADVNCEPLIFSGDIVPAEIDRLSALARAQRPDFIVGAGGGKGIDAGKAVAHALDIPVVTIPTAASNDAPTSKNYVIYDENHRLLRVGHMKRNPEVVVVDTSIIINAPLRMLTAGIGDAIVKKFEVAQCIGAGGPNMFGAAACQAAAALSELCYSTLRAHAAGALAAVKNKNIDEDFERVVEAAVLLSGLAFESGGLSIAHAMTRGLSAVRGARDALHGHQVAYALLVQLTLERRSAEFIDDVAAFYKEVQLPTSLAALGLTQPTEAELRTIAVQTMTASHVKNFERALRASDLSAAVRLVEERYSEGS